MVTWYPQKMKHCSSIDQKTNDGRVKFSSDPLRCFKVDKCALNKEILSLYSSRVNNLEGYKHVGHIILGRLTYGLVHISKKYVCISSIQLIYWSGSQACFPLRLEACPIIFAILTEKSGISIFVLVRWRGFVLLTHSLALGINGQTR